MSSVEGISSEPKKGFLTPEEIEQKFGPWGGPDSILKGPVFERYGGVIRNGLLETQYGQVQFVETAAFESSPYEGDDYYKDGEEKRVAEEKLIWKVVDYNLVFYRQGENGERIEYEGALPARDHWKEVEPFASFWSGDHASLSEASEKIKEAMTTEKLKFIAEETIGIERGER